MASIDHTCIHFHNGMLMKETDHCDWTVRNINVFGFLCGRQRRGKDGYSEIFNNLPTVYAGKFMADKIVQRGIFTDLSVLVVIAVVVLEKFSGDNVIIDRIDKS